MSLAWFAFATYVNEGTLYPPLFNGNAFGGTRYMLLQFVMHAGLARITGEYLVSGKLLAYASAGILYGLLFLICRAISGSSVLSVGLVAAVLSTGAGLLDSTTVRGDTLPVALQLGAVHSVTRRSPTVASRSPAFAGFLCALALFSKLTAVWGAIALVIWLAGACQARRMVEVCGLYLDPPENVLVVSLDEKTGIQAKAPVKPDRPPAPNRPARREHEYTRNGTQCLFGGCPGARRTLR